MNAEKPKDLQVLEIEQLISGPPHAVFDAWTDPEQLKLWFRGGETQVSEVETEPRTGGAYRIVMSEPGRDWVHTGKYLEFDRPRRLVFTWHTPSTEGKETRVTVTLEAEGGNTRLRLVHEQLPDDTFEAHRKGWIELVGKLDRMLA